MNIEMLIRLGTSVFGAVGALVSRGIYDRKRARLREEYRFEKEFLDDVANRPDMHPYLRDKGYRAIAGHERFSADEIAYLLSLKDADLAIRDFALGKPYLEHLPQRGNLQVAFREKYRGSWSRLWRKGLYVSLYCLLSFFSFTPLFYARHFSSQTELLVVLAVSLSTGMYHAALAAIAARRIISAERLVKNQKIHKQVIFLGNDAGLNTNPA